ncbi:MAG TPA: dTMP kinase [Chloroflexota bacterium]|nr:dTMP kinase [Chloroflexota bacterium]
MFITFEGPEGGGKSESARWLGAWLTDRGHAVTMTREPGGTVLGERVRALVLAADVQPSSLAALLLFSASRVELVRQIIRPALEAGQFVICDRHTDSTLAYQGFGDGLPLDEVRAVNRLATGGLSPDLTFLLDVPAEVGLRRRAADGAWNGMDARRLDFHQRVREGFLCLARDDPRRWRVIDASMTRDRVRDALIAGLPAVIVGPRENA